MQVMHVLIHTLHSLDNKYNKKTEITIRFHRRFESIGVMKLKLMEEFGEQVPETLEFHVGYFSGRQ